MHHDPLKAVSMTLALIGLALLAGGCQGQRDDWQSVTLPTTDVQQVFTTAHAAVARDYTVASARFGEGLIVTEPKLVQLTGRDRKLGAIISDGPVQHLRRTARVWVERNYDSTEVRASVTLQREATSQAEAMAAAQQGGRQTVATDQALRADDGQRGTYWADVGRDKDAERSLLDAIAADVEGMGLLVPKALGSGAETAGSLRNEMGGGSRPPTAEDLQFGGGGTSAGSLRREMGIP